MIYHVLPGDSVAQEFEKGTFSGRPIVCRECLIVGPVDAPTRDQFWDERAAFILTEYGEDEIAYHEIVALELERLADVGPDDEVNLWFEYELFCSVNLWFCLSMLESSGASVYRVHPVLLAEEDRWLGFGRFTHDQLAQCLDARVALTDKDMKLGSDLWRAFTTRDFSAFVSNTSETISRDAFPYLAEILAAAAIVDTEPIKIIREIMSTGRKELADVFPEFQSRAGVYGLGDLQVLSLMDRAS